MMHEADMQRLTLELRKTAHKNIVLNEKRQVREWQRVAFWLTVGVVLGTLLGLGARFH